MSRPIILTDEMKSDLENEFTEMLKSLKMPDGKLCYNKSFVYEDSKAVVWLTEEAYRKTVALVTGFSDEVAWHGTVSRALNSDNEFIIDDIFVYPQEVTGSSVNTDREAYTQWLYELDDEVFSSLRMQGHSHVNMGVSPSGVDGSHRKQILEQLEPDMFYIFMIWNKSLSVNTVMYDMSRNILYEDKDVDVKLINSKEMTAFMKDAQAKVKKFGVRKTSKTYSGKKHKKRLAAHQEFDEDLTEYGFYPFTDNDIYDPISTYSNLFLKT